MDASVGLPAARYVATPRDHADRRVALAGRIQEYRFWPPVGPHGILRELAVRATSRSLRRRDGHGVAWKPLGRMIARGDA